MKHSHTVKTPLEQLKDALELNGYKTYRDSKNREVFEQSDRYHEKHLTILADGRVEVYERHYPASEGWSEQTVSVSEALEEHVAF